MVGQVGVEPVTADVSDFGVSVAAGGGAAGGCDDARRVGVGCGGFRQIGLHREAAVAVEALWWGRV